MANISSKAAQIRQAVLGKEVREALASGIEAINAETENTTQRQTVLETLVDEAELIRQSAEEVRIENENYRTNNESIRQTQETERQESITNIENRFNTLTTSQQQAAEVIDARKGEVSLRVKIDAMDAEVASHKSDNVAQFALKVDKVSGKGLSTNDYTTSDKAEVAKVVNKADLSVTNNLQTQINSLSSGSPKATFSTLAALQSDATANTADGKKSIYVVTADGKWYYWNGSVWTSGGTYQSTGIAENSIDISLLKTKKWAEIINGTKTLNIDTLAKTATFTESTYVHNDDGYKLAIAGSTSYTDTNATYICVNRLTGALFSQDITQVTTAYAYVICRIIGGVVYCPFGYKQIRVNGAKPTGANTTFELPDNSVALEKLNFDINAAVRRRQYTLADAWNAWKKGLKFPVAFLGDSTTESDTTAEPPDYNTIGTDHISIGSYCIELESVIKAETGNGLARIYNAGFSSKSAVWALANIDAIIKNNIYYADVKMIGIRHGINDPLENLTTAEYIDSFRTAMRGIIEWCFTNNIQPFLITPQATMIAYPKYSRAGYTSAEMTNISLSVIRELADEYNLELIDNYTYTKMLQLEIPNISSLVPDGLHYKTEGHLYQAGLLFSEFNKETIKLDKAQKIGFNNPEVRSGIGECTKLTSKANGYNSSLTTTSTGTVFKVYLFNHFKYGVTLDFTFTTAGNVTVAINGVNNTLNAANHTISVSGMGLIHIEVKNTSPNNLTFYGVEVR